MKIKKENPEKKNSRLIKYIAGATLSATVIFSGCDGAYFESSGSYYDSNRDLRHPGSYMDDYTFNLWIRGHQVPPHPHSYFRGRPNIITPSPQRPYTPRPQIPRTQPPGTRTPRTPSSPQRPSRPPSQRQQRPSNPRPQTPNINPYTPKPSPSPRPSRPYTPRQTRPEIKRPSKPQTPRTPQVRPQKPNTPRQNTREKRKG